MQNYSKKSESIKDKVTRALNAGQLPRYHGNGFTQLYITPDKSMRFHVWHPAFSPQRGHDAQIHDHRFDMQSVILTGALRHTTYTESTARQGLTHSIYEILGASEFAEASMLHRNNVKLEPRHNYCFSKDSEYTFRNGLLHMSEVADQDKITATVITRTFPKTADKWARVAVALDSNVKDITHAFEPSLQPTQEELNAVIHEALASI